MKDETEEEHESYGLIGFSRTQGNPGRLFGSPLTDHGSFMTLRISRAKRVTDDLGHERYFGGMRGDLIEVKLSASQYAELLTTSNMGCGTPCTVSIFDGREVSDPPDTETTTEKVRLGFERMSREVGKALAEDVAKVKEIMAKKALTKQDREDVLWALERVVQHYQSNAPFMAKVFQETTETLVGAAKAEVDAFITHNIVAEGLRSLAEKALVAAPALPEAKDEDA